MAGIDRDYCPLLRRYNRHRKPHGSRGWVAPHGGRWEPSIHVPPSSCLGDDVPGEQNGLIIRDRYGSDLPVKPTVPSLPKLPEPLVKPEEIVKVKLR